MPLPSSEMATSPPAAPPPLLPSSSAPSGVSALSAAASDLTAVLSVAKMNFSKKRRQTLTTSTLPPTSGAPELDDDPVRLAHPSRRSHQVDVKVPGVLGRAGSVGASSSASHSRSTVLTMASTVSASSFSSSSSSSSLSRGQSSQNHLSHTYSHASDASEDEGRALPPLSSDKQRALVEFIDRSVDDAYNLCHGFGRVRWAPSKTREGVAIHRARGEDDTILDAAVRGKCNVNATVGELMDVLITENTAEFVAHESAVNPTEFLDGQVLHTLVPRTPEDRFVCVKWHCVRSLAPSVAKHRDYVYVEVVDKFRDSNGRLVGYRLSKSIELEELPPTRTAHLFVRAKTLTLQTFAEMEEGGGTLELTTMMINDLGERLPAWLVHKIVDTAAMRTACLRDHINQRRIDFLVYANPKDMVPLSKRICCVVCTKSFSLVRKKYNCVACGDVICNQCSVHQLVTSQSLAVEGPGKRKARICVKCSSGMQTQELPRRRGSLRPSNESSSSGRPSSQRSKRSDEMSRSFLSDTSGGAPSMDSRPSSFLVANGYDDASATASSSGNGSFSASSGSGSRKQAPNIYALRQQSASMGKRTSERSSKASTSSSTEDMAASGLHDDENSDDQDGGGETTEVEQRFPQLLGNSILASTPVELDLGVGKYKETYKMQAQTAEVFELSDDDDVGDFTNTEGSGYQHHNSANADADADALHLTPLRAETVDVDVEVASFLTNEENSIDDEAASGANSGDVSDSDSDTSNFLTVDENSRIVRMSSFSSRGRTPPPQLPADAGEPLSVVMDGLIVEEMVPENASSRPSDPRRSSVHQVPESIAVEGEDEIPVVIRKIAKRVVVGGGRRSRERRPVNPKVQAVVVESIAESESKQQQQANESADPSSDAPAAPPAPTIQLSDLQVHLDRMNEISENLRSLRSGMAATEKKATTQSAMAALESFETKAKADAAAKIAAGFVSAFERSRGLNDRASLSLSSMVSTGGGASTASLASSVASLLSSSGVYPRTSLFNLTLAMGDGSFREYLVDSSFMDVSENPDGSGIGWMTVHSRTTGKVYYYNESCGLTSWTLPGPDTYKGAVYMVL